VKDETLTRTQYVRLPFDGRSKSPSKNYGIHATDVWFALSGKKGAVQFGFTLPAYLPHVAEELILNPEMRPYLFEIRGVSVSFHNLKPTYDGHKKECDCELTPKGVCYPDSSFTLGSDWAKEIFAESNTRGNINVDDQIWEKLETLYKETFK
jgi:hypothetical protein